MGANSSKLFYSSKHRKYNHCNQSNFQGLNHHVILQYVEYPCPHASRYGNGFGYQSGHLFNNYLTQHPYGLSPSLQNSLIPYQSLSQTSFNPFTQNNLVQNNLIGQQLPLIYPTYNSF